MSLIDNHNVIIKKMKKNPGINFALIFFGIATILLSYTTISSGLIKKNGIETEGIVIHLKDRLYPNKYFYNSKIPIVIYFTKDGKSFDIEDCEYCHKIGDRVPIIYDPKNPQNAIINTKGYKRNEIYYALGFLFFFLFFLYLKRKETLSR